MPSVPTEYSDGSWGNIDGDWYAIANEQTREELDNSSIWAAKGTDNRSMTQNPIYYNDDTDGVGLVLLEPSRWKADDVEAGLTGSVRAALKQVNRTAALTSSRPSLPENGPKRWFVFYLCGMAVTVTDQRRILSCTSNTDGLGRYS